MAQIRKFPFAAAIVLAGTVFMAVLPGDAMAQARSVAGSPAAVPAASFRIEIEGVIQGGFKEITGLESEVEVIEYRDGDNLVTQKRPGRPKFNNIILKRDLTDASSAIADWHEAVLEGKVERKSGSIIYIGRDGAELMRYNFTGAWPSRRRISSETNPVTGQVTMIEEIEFVVERIERRR